MIATSAHRYLGDFLPSVFISCFIQWLYLYRGHYFFYLKKGEIRSTQHGKAYYSKHGHKNSGFRTKGFPKLLPAAVDELFCINNNNLKSPTSGTVTLYFEITLILLKYRGLSRS